ncbi:phosphatase PAP2 family protein [Sphingosinicella terrae]|uniref:phosphatase PAP2 family protein n=1 Tax=Sphingosinicella terrae TaxID=2172047 RepID=UPI000E0DD87C|nr:phosphatase PAP2 family protein [Sphingosinicella terrae]
MSGRGRMTGIAAGERACAAACFALVLPFAVFVTVDGRVAPIEYARLTGTFISFAAMIAIGAVICFALLELARAGIGSRWQASPAAAVRAALAKRWREDRLFSLAWPVALFLLLLPAFNAYKQRILPAAGFHFDPQLAALDRALLGTDPGAWLHAAIGSPGVTFFFDAIYHSWFMPTTLGLCFVGLCAGTRTRGQYMLAYAAVWILLGAVCAFLVPAAGPAFYEVLVDPAGAAPFRSVQSGLEAAGGGQVYLTSLGNQAYLLQNLDSPVLVVGAGISAVPSVHNAIAALFALASFRAHRGLGVAMTFYAALIWIGSVYLNWHYAVDGAAGIAGAVLIWIASGRIVDRLIPAAERRTLRPAPLPA